MGEWLAKPYKTPRFQERRYWLQDDFALGLCFERHQRTEIGKED